MQEGNRKQRFSYRRAVIFLVYFFETILNYLKGKNFDYVFI